MQWNNLLHFQICLLNLMTNKILSEESKNNNFCLENNPLGLYLEAKVTQLFQILKPKKYQTLTF